MLLGLTALFSAGGHMSLQSVTCTAVNTYFILGDFRSNEEAANQIPPSLVCPPPNKHNGRDKRHERLIGWTSRERCEALREMKKEGRKEKSEGRKNEISWRGESCGNGGVNDKLVRGLYARFQLTHKESGLHSNGPGQI